MVCDKRTYRLGWPPKTNFISAPNRRLGRRLNHTETCQELKVVLLAATLGIGPDGPIILKGVGSTRAIWLTLPGRASSWDLKASSRTNAGALACHRAVINGVAVRTDGVPRGQYVLFDESQRCDFYCHAALPEC